MAAVTLVQPANPPVARTNTSRANDASASSSFGSYLDKEQASNDVSKAADNAAETTSTAPAEAADGNQKAERKDEQDDGSKVDDAQASTTDPRGLLQWLQSQLPPTVPPAIPSGTVPAQAVLTDGQTGAPLATTAGAISGVLAKLAVKPGDTPPTQAPPPASAGAGGAAAGGSDAAPFQLPDLANAVEGHDSPVTPALAAALDAVLSAGPQNATDVVVSGVQNFQAQLSRADLQQTTPVTPLPPTLAAPLTLDSAELPQRLGDQVQWLTNSGIQEARLQLHPRDLGTIDVQVRIEARGGASVWFAAEHPATRAALEAALPQLRERFTADGLALGQAQVSAQTSGWNFGSSSQNNPRSDAYVPNGTLGSGGFTSEDIDLPVQRPIIHVGLVDNYA